MSNTNGISMMNKASIIENTGPTDHHF